MTDTTGQTPKSKTAAIANAIAAAAQAGFGAVVVESSKDDSDWRGLREWPNVQLGVEVE
ncbi:hypothetical protein ABQF35_28110 [Mycobacterium syngnathidarum]